MSAKNKTVSLFTGDIVQAVKLAERFDIASKANGKTRAKAVLLQALDFMDTVRDDLVQGALIDVGSAWHGPDLFLDKERAQKMAGEKVITDQITGSSSLSLPKKSAEKLATLRKTFKLSSDKQAARLALSVYDSLCDNLWRGNGFSMQNENGQYLPLDTDKVKSKLTFRSGR